MSTEELGPRHRAPDRERAGQRDGSTPGDETAQGGGTGDAGRLTAHAPRSAPQDAWARAGLAQARPPEAHKEPYRTISVIAVAVALALVPAISLLGHRRLAVVWLGIEVLLLALLRLQRPEGTWIAARGRLFDVVFGVLLALGLFALTYYAGLPRVV